MPPYVALSLWSWQWLRFPRLAVLITVSLCIPMSSRKDGTDFQHLWVIIQYGADWSCSHCHGYFNTTYTIVVVSTKYLWFLWNTIFIKTVRCCGSVNSDQLFEFISFSKARRLPSYTYLTTSFTCCICYVDYPVLIFLLVTCALGAFPQQKNSKDIDCEVL